MSNTIDTIFSALSDSTRRAILAMLLEDDMAVTDVAEPFEMSLAAVSKHLMILTRAGLITRKTRPGQMVQVRARSAARRLRVDAELWSVRGREPRRV